MFVKDLFILVHIHCNNWNPLFIVLAKSTIGRLLFLDAYFSACKKFMLNKKKERETLLALAVYVYCKLPLGQ